MNGIEDSVTRFRRIQKSLRLVEGNYANDPHDRGGETYAGIARNFHPRWPGWRIIDEAKKVAGRSLAKLNKLLNQNEELQEMVVLFYKDFFWDPWQGDKVAGISERIAEEIFDTGVNMGITTGVKYLQTALNCLDRNTKSDLVVDGVLGPATLGRLTNYHGEANLIYKMLNVLQGAKYMSIMKASPTQEKYARGWFTRVDFIHT